jgi:hypothetical protein
MVKFDLCWILHYTTVKNEYDKKQNLDEDKKIKKELDKIYRLGGLVPLFTTIFSLDKVKIKIDRL